MVEINVKDQKGDRRQPISIILQIIREQRHQPGENQKIAAAVGNTALERLKNGVVTAIAL